MLIAPIGDIVNSKKWSDAEWVSFFQTRLEDMRSKKKPFEELFREFEAQETALSFYDNQGNLQVNLKLEQNLISIYMGRTN